MKEYKLDYKLSKELFKSNRRLFNSNECYNNIFNLIPSISSNKDDIKVAYGFVYTAGINMFTRHCFVLYKDKIIDPTAMFWTNINTLYDTFYYYPMIEFSIENYLDILDRNKGHIKLYNELLTDEIQLHNELINLGYQRNFGELAEFLERIYKKDLIKGLNEYQINNGIIKK